jgi:hypothetical protein
LDRPDGDICRVLATDVATRSNRKAGAGLSSVALLAAVGFGVIAQGGYYGPQLAVLTVLVCAATGLAGLAGASHPAVWGTLGLAVVAVVSGMAAGDVGRSWSTVAICVCAAGSIVVARSLNAADRETVMAGLLAAGVIVGGLAWTGVAFHLQPLALDDGGLWRGASGLTYANATAGFLVPLALMAMARVVEARQAPSRTLSIATFLLLVGAGSTLSRGGALGLAIGAVALLVILDWRGCLATWAPLVFGAAIGVAGLAASMPSTSQANPLLALGALAAGGGVVLAGYTLPERLAPWLLAGVLAVIPVVAVLTPGRWNASSPDRSHETAAALSTITHHAVLGVSPGRYLLTWNDSVLGPRQVLYAHDEYLQLAGEMGVVGVAVAAIAAVSVISSAWRVRSRRAVWCGPVAALVALAAHSGLDFLWHIPLIVVLAGFLVGLVVPPALGKKETSSCTYPG